MSKLFRFVFVNLAICSFFAFKLLIETAKRLPPHPVGEAGQIQEKGLWSQAVLWQAEEHENKQVKLKISSIS